MGAQSSETCGTEEIPEVHLSKFKSLSQAVDISMGDFQSSSLDSL